jgi:hypothetical protein
MGFVQVIELRMSEENMRQLREEVERVRASGDSTVQRSYLCRDRDDAGRYFNLVFFESYEEAMKNSERPEVGEFAQRMQALVDGPPTFYNLDVVEELS